MTDIVERLHQVQGDNEDAREAADEIKQLRAEAAILRTTEAAEIERLRAALTAIACIENQDWGPDWEEIEEARKIANAALEPKP